MATLPHNLRNVTVVPTVSVMENFEALALKGDLSDPTLATNGAGMVVRNSSIAYPVGTVGRDLNELSPNQFSILKYGALCNGVADDTAAINSAVLAAANAGGGRVLWPTGKTCRIVGPVFVLSNIDYDLNGCTVTGSGPTTGVMFETGYLNTGVLTTTVGTAYQSQVVRNAKLHGGYATNVGKFCNFQNFNMGCKVYDIELFNARQFGVFDACFYAKFDTVMHSGGTSDTLPSFHFKSANNAIRLHAVTTTCAWDYHFEGGGTAVSMIGCTQEGGVKGIKIDGDMLGFTIVGNYVEAIPGTWLDLATAGAVTLDISGSYFNYVDIVIADSADSVLFGRWCASNQIVNVGQQIGGTGPVYRGRMQISGRQNHVEYRINNQNDYSVALPAHWIIGGNTDIRYTSTFQATSLTDYRKKALANGGALIPLRMSGDTGTSFAGFVPFTTITLGATTTIDTQIKWQPNSLFAKFSLAAVDGGGTHELYGDIYGAFVKRQDADAMVVAISNNSGMLRISLTQTSAPFTSVTGSVQICA